MDKQGLVELRQLLDAALTDGVEPDVAWRSRFKATIQSLGSSPEANAAQFDFAIAALFDAVFANAPMSNLPDWFQSNQKLAELYAALLELRQFTLALSHGDLARALRLKGFTAGALKNLQASLRHLTWQTQMIARGDFNQRVEFMGEFSDAFNAMVVRLEETLNQLKHHESELAERNTALTREITERQQAEEKLRASEELFRSLIQTSPDGVCITDLTGTLTFSSRKALEMVGYSDWADIRGKNVLEFIAPEFREQATVTVRELLKGNYTGVAEYKAVKKDAQVFWAETKMEVLRDAAGAPTGIFFIIRDITERKHAEEIERDLRILSETLRDTAAVLNSTLNVSEVLDFILAHLHRVLPHDAANIMLIDDDGLVIIPRGHGYADPDPKDILAQRFQLAQIPVLRTMVETQSPVVIRDTRTSAQWSNLLPGAAWIRSYAGVPIAIKGKVIGFLNLDSGTPGFFTIEHVERLQAFANQAALAIENARLYAEVQHSAITDSLTGIYNRRHLMELAARELERARRYNRSFSILMLDIDHFKTINDTYGHAAGDCALQVVVERFRKDLRRSDVLGRYGGEEFLALLPETNTDQAQLIAERLRNSIALTPIETGRGAIAVTVSIGVAMWEAVAPPLLRAETLDEFIERADQSLYQAKHAGRNRVFMLNTTVRQPVVK